MYAGPERRRDWPELVKRYQRLLEVTRKLSSTLDLTFLLQTIIQAAADLTDTEAASIMLLDANSGQLHFEAMTNADPSSMEKIVVPLEGSVAGAIFTSGRPMIIEDTANHPLHFRKVDAQTTFITRSILGAPLTSKEKPIGVIQAINKKDGGTFTQVDVQTLEALASQAAVAIVNARLFQQSDSIADLVHELRQPLNSLNAATAILMRPNVPEAMRKEFVQTIQGETGRLNVMTTDFLDLTKMESGRMRFVQEPFNLFDLASECAKIVTPQATQRQVSVHVRIPHPEWRVKGDRAKLKQVFLNLLTNAVKYNREGGSIYIDGEVVSDWMKVSVEDTGRGIPPEALPKMFQKFYRVPETADEATPGTGLGLAIAKKIVEVHGGEVVVDSTVGVGTTFSFSLPLA